LIKLSFCIWFSFFKYRYLFKTLSTLPSNGIKGLLNAIADIALAV